VFSIEELKRLDRESPAELTRALLAERREFVFGVEDDRDDFGTSWGGEFRVTLNKNVVLHFVPGMNAEMPDRSSLPQFSVMPDDLRDGDDEVVSFVYEDLKDVDPFEGVIFYVGRERYERLTDELADVARRYGAFDRIPDAYLPDSELVRMISRRVLEHPVVAAERPFDFSKR